MWYIHSHPVILTWDYLKNGYTILLIMHILKNPKTGSHVLPVSLGYCFDKWQHNAHPASNNSHCSSLPQACLSSWMQANFSGMPVVKTIMASTLLCRKNGRQRHWLGHRQADCISEAGFADALVQPYEIQHPLLFQKKKHVLLLLSTTLKQWQMGIAWSFRQTRARRSWKSANSKKTRV